MNADARLDELRTSTLDQIDRTEKNYARGFLVFALLEAVVLGAFLYLTDFRDRTQLLVVVAAIGVYTVLGSGLLLLGTHVTRNTLRVLKAIEASGR